MGNSEPRTPGLSYTSELEELLAEAQRLALESAHAAVTIEHVLLAFVDAHQAGTLLELDAAARQTLRAQIVARLLQRTGDPASFGRVPPPTEALSDVLTASEARARALGLDQVDAASVVASLIETGSPVADWLRDLGLTPPPPPPPPAPEEAPVEGAPPSSEAAKGPPPLVPDVPLGPPDDDDVIDAPTEEAALSPAVPDGLASDRATDPGESDEASEAPADVTRTKQEAQPEDATQVAPAPSLEPAPWNVGEFDDELPTVHAPARGRPSSAPRLDEDDDGDEEPTRYADHSADKRSANRDQSVIDETFDEFGAEEEDEPSAKFPRDLDGLQSGAAPLAPGQPGESFSVPPSVIPTIGEGQLAENIPRRMQVDRPQTIQVRLGHGGDAKLRKGMQGLVSTHAMKVTQAMSARLVAPDGGFLIELGSPETQWIDDPDGLRDAPAEWVWTITPTKSGRRRLQLVVGARTVRDGMIAEAALPMQVIEIEVSANHARTLVQATSWLVATLFGGVIGVFSEEILKWAQGVLGPLP